MSVHGGWFFPSFFLFFLCVKNSIIRYHRKTICIRVSGSCWFLHYNITIESERWHGWPCKENEQYKGQRVHYKPKKMPVTLKLRNDTATTRSIIKLNAQSPYVVWGCARRVYPYASDNVCIEIECIIHTRSIIKCDINIKLNNA